MKKSSIHFEQVQNIEFEASHLGRTELHEPKYLLPVEHRLPNFTLEGSMPFDQVEQHFHQAKERMTGQAKARGSSPLWDGVMVLPDVDDPKQFEAVARARLNNWATAYQKLTGHRVLNITVHQDEGYIDDEGRPRYNKHAHILIDRLDADGRVIKLERAQLGRVQDMTAEVMGMQRGSTLKERDGKRGRAHVPHREYRAKAEAERLARIDLERSELQREALDSQLDQERDYGREQRLQLQVEHEQTVEGLLRKLKTADKKAEKLAAQLETAKAKQHAAQVSELKTQEALKTAHSAFSAREAYIEVRGAFKAHGGALQAHYSALKRLHDSGNEAGIKAMHDKLHDRDSLYSELESLTGIDFDQLGKSPPPSDSYGPSF